MELPFFFQSNKFELLRHTSFTLDGGNGLPEKSWDQVALVAELKFIQTDQKDSPVVTVVATHLKSNHGGDFENIRVAQLKNLLERLLKWDTENRPTIICGDFNCNPSSACYRLLFKGEAKGVVAGEVLDKNKKIQTKVTLSHPRKFLSAYNLGKPKPGLEPWTTYTKSNACTLDYIWYTESLIATGILSIPEKRDMPSYIPSSHFPSDHLLLVAHFAFVE